MPIGSKRPSLACLGFAAGWPIVLLGFLAAQGSAAEIRLRAECQPDGNLIVLGDVAEILGTSDEQQKRLAAIELFPAPPPGGQRFIRRREIMDRVRAHRLNLAEHRMTGAYLVTIRRPETPGAANPPGQPVQNPVEQSLDMARQAIADYLRSATPDTDSTPWNIQLKMTSSQSRRVAAAQGPIVADGGKTPWEGHQNFVLHFQTVWGDVRLPVQARVSKLAQVVVATRALPRGAVLRATDLAVRTADPLDFNARKAEVMQAVDQAVGMETLKPVQSGEPLDRRHLRRPVLIKRNEEVTVYARTAGIVARTTARAREDGSLGDLILLENPNDRQRFYARVTGVKQVDVYAQTARAEQSGQ